MRAEVKDRFDSLIQRMTLTNEISPASLPVAKGKSVSSIFVFHVAVRSQDVEERIILLLTKLIHQHIVIALEYADKIKFAVFMQKLITSEWTAKEKATLQIRGLDLDAIWEHIIVQIGDIRIEHGRTLNEQIAADEQKTKLETEIARLEKMARAERQPNKKFELVQKMQNLKEKILL